MSVKQIHASDCNTETYEKKVSNSARKVEFTSYIRLHSTNTRKKHKNDCLIEFLNGNGVWAAFVCSLAFFYPPTHHHHLVPAKE